MIRIWSGRTQEASDWVNAGWGYQIADGERLTSLVLEDNLAIRAVVFYNNYHPGNSVQMHIAALPGRKWLTRPFLSAAFRYPFVQLGVRRIGAEINALNHDSLRFARHIGFVDEGIQRQAGPGGQDIVALGMLKTECRWLSGPEPQIWGDQIGQVAGSAGELRSQSDGGPEQRVSSLDRRLDAPEGLRLVSRTA